MNKKNSKIEILEKRIAELESLGNKKNKINTINNNINELQDLYVKLDDQGKKIENLNSQLLGNIIFDDLKYVDNLIVVNITSSDSKINFPIVCKSSTIFSEIERIIYKKYPDYGKNYGEDNLFLANGTKMRGYMTMAENGFSGYKITVMKRDLDNKI